MTLIVFFVVALVAAVILYILHLRRRASMHRADAKAWRACAHNLHADTAAELAIARLAEDHDPKLYFRSVQYRTGEEARIARKVLSAVVGKQWDHMNAAREETNS